MRIKKGKIIIISVVAVVAAIFIFLSFEKVPPVSQLEYGVSFSKFHSEELGLDWKETYLALLDDLGVRRFRFSAHWPSVEPEEGEFNFSELDFQMQEAQKRGASVILAIGRRLPGWPECHEPNWLGQLIASNQPTEKELKQTKILEYLEQVVNRYKNYDNVLYWQVENEPFLTLFSQAACGEELDKKFLEEEIALVKKLDEKQRPVLLTDSGELGWWWPAYRRGDAFGTSMYLYIWSPEIGPFRYPLKPVFFRIKKNITELIYGKKPSVVIELSTEPWLLNPIVETPVDVLLDRMGLDKLNEMIGFSSKTGFDTFYLWGAEWWYWMKIEQNHPEFWEWARELFI